MFRDAFGRSYGDVFGCPCSSGGLQRFAGIAASGGPSRLHPTLPPPTMRAFGSAAYGVSDAELTAMGWGPQSQWQDPSGGGSGGSGNKVNWNQVASGAGSFLSTLFQGRGGQGGGAPVQQSAPPVVYQTQPVQTSTSWVGPVAAIGGVGILGVIAYLLTKS